MCIADRSFFFWGPHQRRGFVKMHLGSGDKWGRLVRWQLGGGPEEPVGSLSKEERQENLRYPKSTVGFGIRWIVEIVISAIKRMFGEDVKALKWSNIVQEVKLRIWLYNKWIAEAVAAV